MTLQEAQAQLYDQSFLVGGRRQRAAVMALAGMADPQAVEALAKALEDGHQADLIRERLAAMEPATDQPKIDALWSRWAKGRHPVLATLLKELGWPCGVAKLAPFRHLKVGDHAAFAKAVRPDVANVRRVLDLLNDPDQDLVAGGLHWLQALPPVEPLHDPLYEAWLERPRPELTALLDTPRHAGRLVLEAAYALATGQAERYLALNDESGELFAQAYATASEELRQQMRATGTSGDARLAAGYDRATRAVGRHDPAAELTAARARRDEDAIFLALRDLSLIDALPTVETWARSGARPTDPARRAAVEAAVAAYAGLGKLTIEALPAPGDGLEDWFTVVQREAVTEAQLRERLRAEDPLVRAGALLVGHGRGLVDPATLTAAAGDEHWPVRLVARLLSPALAGAAAEDHVLWVNAAAGVEASVLTSAVGGNPGTLAGHRERLARIGGAATPPAQRAAALLTVLCALQEQFVRSDVTGTEVREATESTGVTTADAPLDE